MVVELTTIDAQSFIEFKRHQALFQRMLETGCFDVHGGKVTLHFDADGTLRKIEKDEIVFKQ